MDVKIITIIDVLAGTSIVREMTESEILDYAPVDMEQPEE